MISFKQRFKKNQKPSNQNQNQNPDSISVESSEPNNVLPTRYVKHIRGSELFKRVAVEPQSDNQLTPDFNLTELADELLLDLNQYVNGFESPAFLNQVIADIEHLPNDIWSVLDKEDQTLADRLVKMATSTEKHERVNEVLNQLFLSAWLTFSETELVKSQVTFWLTHKNQVGDQLFHHCLYSKSSLLLQTCWQALLEIHYLEQHHLKASQTPMKKLISGINEIQLKLKEKIDVQKTLNEKIKINNQLLEQCPKALKLQNKVKRLTNDLTQVLNEIGNLKQEHQLKSAQLNEMKLNQSKCVVSTTALHDLLTTPDSRGATPFQVVKAAGSPELLNCWLDVVRHAFNNGWLSVDERKKLSRNSEPPHKESHKNIQQAKPRSFFANSSDSSVPEANDKPGKAFIYQQDLGLFKCKRDGLFVRPPLSSIGHKTQKGSKKIRFDSLRTINLHPPGR